MKVPFFRPELNDDEVAEVVSTLRSGWLTTGPRVRRFEAEFARAVGAEYAVAMNSCTAALHLATLALGLRAGQVVLIPTMTFAATAEVIRYAGAIPVLVDCDAERLHMDLRDAERKIENLRTGHLPPSIDRDAEITGMVPVHVGGVMMDIASNREFAARHGLWQVEDAAHSFPSAWRPEGSEDDGDWQRCGESTADVSCFSFYANKTLTTGEGGMATTGDEALAAQMRSLSLHGLSNDAWGRYTSKGAWDYRILAPGYKYNLTDIAAALGLQQLARAEEMRLARERIALEFIRQLRHVDELEIPTDPGPDRIHSWHLFQVKLRPGALSIDRDALLEELRELGVGFSVHWRPLHLHPYWADQFGWRPEHLPTATEVWRRTVSLPIFPAMTDAEVAHVVASVEDVCRRHRTRSVSA
ncbi:MAG: DegT/DnrJ/EryC1/StrS family aminotransferase [Thermoanaerobaculia bacterium]|nr:DegT/DnrJ/EryC1/StrS family aminotransferase [Thermoanaerobaculia bacterium]